MGFGRTWLYHQEYPKGEIFTTEQQYLEALKAGAVEAPWLVDQQEPEGKDDPEKAKAGPSKPRKKRGFDLTPLEE